MGIHSTGLIPYGQCPCIQDPYLFRSLYHAFKGWAGLAIDRNIGTTSSFLDA